MNYKLLRQFDYANQNLIFHIQEPAERWCFARAHLIHAAVVSGHLKFRFPLYQVKVKVAAPKEVLERVLGGSESLFSNVAEDRSDSTTIVVESIVVESLELAPY